MKIYYQSLVFITVVGALSYSECMYPRYSVGPLESNFYQEQPDYEPQIFTSEQNSYTAVPVQIMTNSSGVVHEQEQEEEMHHHAEAKEDGGVGALQLSSDFYESLQDAVMHDHADIVKAYLDQGINVNTQYNSTGESLLHLAVVSNADAVAQLLLDRHADINIIDDQGDTPLHYATQDNQVFMVELLFARGANTQIRNKEGKLAIDYATSLCRQFFIQQKFAASNQKLTL
jgi:ankyrin repeat protein